MEYCYLGHSGLEVSRIGLGAIPFGTVLDEKGSRNMVDMFYDAGGNYLDTANVYGGGMRGSNAEMAGTVERTVGKIIRRALLFNEPMVAHGAAGFRCTDQMSQDKRKQALSTGRITELNFALATRVIDRSHSTQCSWAVANSDPGKGNKDKGKGRTNS